MIRLKEVAGPTAFDAEHKRAFSDRLPDGCVRSGGALVQIGRQGDADGLGFGIFRPLFLAGSEWLRDNRPHDGCGS
jgi:hypothetical protein